MMSDQAGDDLGLRGVFLGVARRVAAPCFCLAVAAVGPVDPERSADQVGDNGRFSLPPCAAAPGGGGGQRIASWRMARVSAAVSTRDGRYSRPSRAALYRR